MIADSPEKERVKYDSAKLITCVLPDDGTYRTLLNELRTGVRTDQIITRSGLGIAAFADANIKPGTLPDAYSVRIVHIITTREEADEVFEYCHKVARINRPGGGVIIQTPLATATPFELETASEQ